MLKQGRTTLPLLLALVALLAACSSPMSRKWQRVFFDGVPSEEAAPDKSKGSEAPVSLAASAEPASEPAQADGPVLFSHKPFADRQCDACHESIFSQGLLTDETELCQRCHHTTMANTRFQHAPTAAGACLSCHDPHQSTEKGLLLQPSRSLCSDCHEGRGLSQRPGHAGSDADQCQSCHNPHGADNRFFLKKEAISGAIRTDKP